MADLCITGVFPLFCPAGTGFFARFLPVTGGPGLGPRNKHVSFKICSKEMEALSTSFPFLKKKNRNKNNLFAWKSKVKALLFHHQRSCSVSLLLFHVTSPRPIKNLLIDHSILCTEIKIKPISFWLEKNLNSLHRIRLVYIIHLAVGNCYCKCSSLI